MKFTCPKCEQATISIKDKYRANLWKLISCSNCGARLTASPWILVAIQILYLWNIAWWIAMYKFDAPHLYYFGLLVLVWLFIDFLGINLVPLAVIRQRAPAKQ